MTEWIPWAAVVVQLGALIVMARLRRLVFTTLVSRSSLVGLASIIAMGLMVIRRMSALMIIGGYDVLWADIVGLPAVISLLLMIDGILAIRVLQRMRACAAKPGSLVTCPRDGWPCPRAASGEAGQLADLSA